jgi:hypothetical protein
MSEKGSERGKESDKTAQGTEIILNGQKFPTAWVQWRDGNSERIGISDTGLMQLLGLELLNANQPTAQPIRWFSPAAEQPPVLPARLIPPYRYLDVTELLAGAGAQLRASGSTLRLDLPAAQIASIREGNQTWGKRIVIDLSRPTAWQVSQAKSEGVVTVAGTAAPDLLARFQPRSPNFPGRNNGDEDELLSSSRSQPNLTLFSLENAGTATKIKVNLPAAHSLRAFSLTDPYRLVIDVLPNPMAERQIAWAEGLTWHQQLVRLGAAIFPVNWLEVNLRSSRLALKPITSNASSQEGIAPLVTTARAQQAAAAINGGFFNRNNKLPLGAIRRDGGWLSGPILNRGAIAWNERGEVKIGRLSLRETLVAAAGKRLAVSSLNSGYVTAGIARYTPAWGAAYTPLSDGEILISVQEERVTNQQREGKAGGRAFPIPANGYLLTIRKNNVPAADLAVGTPVRLETTTVPADFANYPQIVGAGPLLVLEGRIVLNAAAEKFSPAFEQQQASRSAIGITSQGTLIVAAAHNRVGGRGASLREMAQIMQQLGAVAALNLDGGSSTSLFLGGHLIDRSPVTAARVHNGIGIFINP